MPGAVQLIPVRCAHAPYDQVGSSAFNLRKTLQERREARKGTARIRRLAGEDDDEEDENDAGTSLRYQRGMLKLDLSDGLTVCKVCYFC